MDYPTLTLYRFPGHVALLNIALLIAINQPNFLAPKFDSDQRNQALGSSSLGSPIISLNSRCVASTFANALAFFLL